MKTNFYEELKNGKTRVDSKAVAKNLFAAADMVITSAAWISVLNTICGVIICVAYSQFGTRYIRPYVCIGVIALTVFSLILILTISTVIAGMLRGRAAMVENSGSQTNLLFVNAKVMRGVQREIATIKTEGKKDISDDDDDDEHFIQTYIDKDYLQTCIGKHDRHKKNLFYSK